MLEGTMGFRLGDTVVEAGAGSAVFVPRGVPHTFLAKYDSELLN